MKLDDEVMIEKNKAIFYSRRDHIIRNIELAILNKKTLIYEKKLNSKIEKLGVPVPNNNDITDPRRGSVF